MTGAPVPIGVDAIVPFENTDEMERSRQSDIIRILEASPIGSGIRPAGSGMRIGGMALRRGSILTPSRLGTIFSSIATLIEQHRPDQASIEKVFVNGEIVWNENKATGARPGRVLTK